MLIEGVKYYANNPVMIGKTFLRLERDFDKHVNYCRDESNAQEFLISNDIARDFFEVNFSRSFLLKLLILALKMPSIENVQKNSIVFPTTQFSAKSFR